MGSCSRRLVTCHLPLSLTDTFLRVFSRTLIAELNSRCDPLWAELRKSKELTEQSLARILPAYGVRPRTIWIGESSAKGYVQDDFMDVFRRYITKSQVEALRAEIASAQVETKEQQKQPPVAVTPEHAGGSQRSS